LSQAAQNGAVTVQESGPLDEMDWSKLNRTSVLAEDGGIAVTLAEFGIAETGSVVFRSGSHGPILQNFLPLYHIVVLKASTLLAYPEDLWSHLGGKSAPQSRLLTIVTGTSGTADIEAKNVRGAHGPRFMHIIVVLD
jgi:L-lactate dehydrogenase complex protein LldG